MTLSQKETIMLANSALVIILCQAITMFCSETGCVFGVKIFFFFLKQMRLGCPETYAM